MAAALQEIGDACAIYGFSGHGRQQVEFYLYLRDMCAESRYLVIEDTAALPRDLPKIYQRVVGPGR